MGISLDGSAREPRADLGDDQGPIRRADRSLELPQVDLSVRRRSGRDQSVDLDGGLIATEDNAFVEYQGEVYEVGTPLLERFSAL